MWTSDYGFYLNSSFVDNIHNIQTFVKHGDLTECGVLSTQLISVQNNNKKSSVGRLIIFKNQTSMEL